MAGINDVLNNIILGQNADPSAALQEQAAAESRLRIQDMVAQQEAQNQNSLRMLGGTFTGGMQQTGLASEASTAANNVLNAIQQKNTVSEQIARDQLSSTMQAQQALNENGPGTLEEAWKGGKMSNWLAQTAGQAAVGIVPQTAAALGTRALTSKIPGLGAVAPTLAGMATGYDMNRDEVVGQMLQDPASWAAAQADPARARALLNTGATASSALDFAPGAIASGIGGRLGKRAAMTQIPGVAHTAADMLIEGGTELGQGIAAQTTANRIAGQDLKTAFENSSGSLDDFVGGALGAGMVSGAGHAAVSGMNKLQDIGEAQALAAAQKTKELAGAANARLNDESTGLGKAYKLGTNLLGAGAQGGKLAAAAAAKAANAKLVAYGVPDIFTPEGFAQANDMLIRASEAQDPAEYLSVFRGQGTPGVAERDSALGMEYIAKYGAHLSPEDQKPLMDSAQNTGALLRMAQLLAAAEEPGSEAFDAATAVLSGRVSLLDATPEARIARATVTNSTYALIGRRAVEKVSDELVRFKEAGAAFISDVGTKVVGQANSMAASAGEGMVRDNPAQSNVRHNIQGMSNDSAVQLANSLSQLSTKSSAIKAAFSHAEMVKALPNIVAQYARSEHPHELLRVKQFLRAGVGAPGSKQYKAAIKLLDEVTAGASEKHAGTRPFVERIANIRDMVGDVEDSSQEGGESFLESKLTDQARETAGVAFARNLQSAYENFVNAYSDKAPDVRVNKAGEKVASSKESPMQKAALKRLQAFAPAFGGEQGLREVLEYYDPSRISQAAANALEDENTKELTDDQVDEQYDPHGANEDPDEVLQQQITDIQHNYILVGVNGNIAYSVHPTGIKRGDDRYITQASEAGGKFISGMKFFSAMLPVGNKREKTAAGKADRGNSDIGAFLKKMKTLVDHKLAQERESSPVYADLVLAQLPRMSKTVISMAKQLAERHADGNAELRVLNEEAGWTGAQAGITTKASGAVEIMPNTSEAFLLKKETLEKLRPSDIARALRAALFRMAKADSQSKAVNEADIAQFNALKQLVDNSPYADRLYGALYYQAQSIKKKKGEAEDPTTHLEVMDALSARALALEEAIMKFNNGDERYADGLKFTVENPQNPIVTGEQPQHATDKELTDYAKFNEDKFKSGSHLKVLFGTKDEATGEIKVTGSTVINTRDIVQSKALVPDVSGDARFKARLIEGLKTLYARPTVVGVQIQPRYGEDYYGAVKEGAPKNVKPDGKWVDLPNLDAVPGDAWIIPPNARAGKAALTFGDLFGRKEDKRNYKDPEEEAKREARASGMAPINEIVTDTLFAETEFPMRFETNGVIPSLDTANDAEWESAENDDEFGNSEERQVSRARLAEILWKTSLGIDAENMKSKLQTAAQKLLHAAKMRGADAKADKMKLVESLQRLAGGVFKKRDYLLQQAANYNQEADEMNARKERMQSLQTPKNLVGQTRTGRAGGVRNFESREKSLRAIAKRYSDLAAVKNEAEFYSGLVALAEDVKNIPVTEWSRARGRAAKKEAKALMALNTRGVDVVRDILNNKSKDARLAARKSTNEKTKTAKLKSAARYKELANATPMQISEWLQRSIKAAKVNADKAETTAVAKHTEVANRLISIAGNPKELESAISFNSKQLREIAFRVMEVMDKVAEKNGDERKIISDNTGMNPDPGRTNSGYNTAPISMAPKSMQQIAIWEKRYGPMGGWTIDDMRSISQGIIDSAAPDEMARSGLKKVNEEGKEDTGAKENSEVKAVLEDIWDAFMSRNFVGPMQRIADEDASDFPLGKVQGSDNRAIDMRATPEVVAQREAANKKRAETQLSRPTYYPQVQYDAVSEPEFVFKITPESVGDISTDGSAAKDLQAAREKYVRAARLLSESNRSPVAYLDSKAEALERQKERDLTTIDLNSALKSMGEILSTRLNAHHKISPPSIEQLIEQRIAHADENLYAASIARGIGKAKRKSGDKGSAPASAAAPAKKLTGTPEQIAAQVKKIVADRKEQDKADRDSVWEKVGVAPPPKAVSPNSAALFLFTKMQPLLSRMERAQAPDGVNSVSAPANYVDIGYESVSKAFTDFMAKADKMSNRQLRAEVKRRLTKVSELGATATPAVTAFRKILLSEIEYAETLLRARGEVTEGEIARPFDKEAFLSEFVSVEKAEEAIQKRREKLAETKEKGGDWRSIEREVFALMEYVAEENAVAAMTDLSKEPSFSQIKHAIDYALRKDMPEVLQQILQRFASKYKLSAEGQDWIGISKNAKAAAIRSEYSARIAAVQEAITDAEKEKVVASYGLKTATGGRRTGPIKKAAESAVAAAEQALVAAQQQQANLELEILDRVVKETKNTVDFTADVDGKLLKSHEYAQRVKDERGLLIAYSKRLAARADALEQVEAEYKVMKDESAVAEQEAEVEIAANTRQERFAAAREKKSAPAQVAAPAAPAATTATSQVASFLGHSAPVAAKDTSALSEEIKGLEYDIRTAERAIARGANKSGVAYSAQTIANMQATVDEKKARLEKLTKGSANVKKSEAPAAPAGGSSMNGMTYERALDQIVKMRGDKISLGYTELVQALDGSGQYEKHPDLGRIIRIAINAMHPEATINHEALHDLWATLGTSKKIRTIKMRIERYANSNFMRVAIAQGMARMEAEQGTPEFDAAVMKYTKHMLSNREEAVAYLFQLYTTDEKIRGHIRGERVTENETMLAKAHGLVSKVFDAIASYFGALTGIVLESTQMENIFAGLFEGKFADQDTQDIAFVRQAGATVSDKLQDTLGPVYDAAMKVYDTGLDRVREMGVPALTSIANYISLPSGEMYGGSDFVTTRQHYQNMMQANFSAVLKGKTDEEVADALHILQSQAESDNPLVKDIRRILTELHGFSNHFGAKLGFVKNYFPISWDIDTILQDREGFTKLVVEHAGVSRAEAEFMVDNMVTTGGNSDLADNEHHLNYVAPMGANKHRTLKFVNESNGALFAKYQVNEMHYTLEKYSSELAHRVTFAQFFGDDGKRIEEAFKKAKEEGATEEELVEAKRAIQGAMGIMDAPRMTPMVRTGIAWTMTAMNTAMLPLAIFSQFIDPLAIAARSGDIVDAGRAYMQALRSLRKTVMRDKTENEDEELANWLGVTEGALSSQMLGHIVHMPKGNLRKINQAYFKWNGMQGFNNAMRTAAVTAGARYITKAFKESNHAALSELGLEVSQASYNTDGSLRFRNNMALSTALTRYVESSVVRADNAHQPTWMNDPAFAILAHMRRFTYAFSKTVLQRAWAQGNMGNIGPLAILASTIPIMIAVDMAKWAMAGGGPPTETWGVMDFIKHGLNRSGLMGQMSAFASMAPGEGMLAHRFELGPGIDVANNLFKGDIDKVLDQTVFGARYLPSV